MYKLFNTDELPEERLHPLSQSFLGYAHKKLLQGKADPDANRDHAVPVQQSRL